MKIFGFYVGKYKQPKIEYRNLNEFSLSDYNLLLTCLKESRDSCKHIRSGRFKARQNMINRITKEMKILYEEIQIAINR